MLLFSEMKFKNTLTNDILITKLNGRFIAYESRNSINFNA